MDKRKEAPDKPARMNPLVRFVYRRVMLVVLLVAAIVASCGACAIFAPYSFQQILHTAQSAGLRTYALVLGITGNPTLKVVTYDADVTTSASVTRDMGIFSLIYGEGANVTGTVRVSLGADLKNSLFGTLSCDVDMHSVRTVEGRAPFAGVAFDPQQIRQEAYAAFEHEASQQALAKYWPEARRRLQGQFTSWALGVTIPELPTLTECPSNLSPAAAPTP